MSGRKKFKKMTGTSLSEFPPLLPELLLEVWVRPALVVEVDTVADDGGAHQADTQGRSVHHRVTSSFKDKTQSGSWQEGKRTGEAQPTSADVS